MFTVTLLLLPLLSLFLSFYYLGSLDHPVLLFFLLFCCTIAVLFILLCTCNLLLLPLGN